MMNQRMNVEWDVLHYAFRYALGRKTYAPTDVQAAIRANFMKIEEKDLEMVITEITTAVARNEAGMQMDVDQWLDFARSIQGHLDARRSRSSKLDRAMFVAGETGLPVLTVTKMLDNGWEWDEDARLFSAPKKS